MILHGDKSKIAEIIARRKDSQGKSVGSSPMKSESVKSESGEIDGRHIAAKELLMAIHEKSPEKLMKALMNFQDIHASMIKHDEE